MKLEEIEREEPTLWDTAMQWENKIKQQEARIRELEPLASAYLDCRQRIEELREGIREVLDGTIPYLTEKRLKKLLMESYANMP